MKKYVDTTKTTHVSLCAGYGGIDLGLSRAIPNMRTVAFSEIEAFACANLVSKMEAGLLDPAPIWTNLKTFPWEEFRGKVDILSGGYPCQPFSGAGKRLGKEDPRHLWPFIADGIALMRPSVCFFENVEGHISMGLSDVIEDLAGMGYRTTWGIFSASEVGAPHQRKRVFILACSTSNGGREDNWIRNSRPADQANEVWPSRPGQPQHGWEPPRVVQSSRMADTKGIRHIGLKSECGSVTIGGVSQVAITDEKHTGEPIGLSSVVEPPRVVGNTNSPRPQERSRQGRSELQGADTNGGEDADWQTQPSMGGDFDGTPSRMDYAKLCVTCDNRTDELRLLGNGVVPATAERAFRTLIKELL
jgi:DNA (cytosine-5)-methyltransferase 1